MERSNVHQLSSIKNEESYLVLSQPMEKLLLNLTTKMPQNNLDLLDLNVKIGL
jgi:hypothetical protein